MGIKLPSTRLDKQTKRNHGKTTKDTAKQPIWVDLETGMEKTAIHWRLWAKDEGLLTEKEGKTLFNIVNGSGKLIIKLTRKQS